MPAGVLFGALVSFDFRAIRVAADGLTKDADQYGYSDDHDDHENEQRDYGDGHEIFPSRGRIEATGVYSSGNLYIPYSSVLVTAAGWGRIDLPHPALVSALRPAASRFTVSPPAREAEMLIG